MKNLITIIAYLIICNIILYCIIIVNAEPVETPLNDYNIGYADGQKSIINQLDSLTLKKLNHE